METTWMTLATRDDLVVYLALFEAALKFERTSSRFAIFCTSPRFSQREEGNEGMPVSGGWGVILCWRG